MCIQSKATHFTLRLPALVAGVTLFLEHLFNQMKKVTFQEHVVRYIYQYNPSAPIVQTSPLIDDTQDRVTSFSIKRQYLKAQLHSTHLRRKERRQHGLPQEFRCQNV